MGLLIAIAIAIHLIGFMLSITVCIKLQIFEDISNYGIIAPLKTVLMCVIWEVHLLKILVTLIINRNTE